MILVQNMGDANIQVLRWDGLTLQDTGSASRPPAAPLAFAPLRARERDRGQVLHSHNVGM